MLTGGLAIIFLFPLLWAAVASVSPQAATGQTVGIGFGNYATLFNFGAGLPRFLFNSLFVAFMVVAITLVVSGSRRLRVRPLQFSRAVTRSSC